MNICIHDFREKLEPYTTEYNATPNKVIQILVPQIMNSVAVSLTGKFDSISRDFQSGDGGRDKFYLLFVYLFSLFIVYLKTLLICQVI
jgi:hypothetical protein